MVDLPRNNLDLIRLFAAFQVMVHHGLIHLKLDALYTSLVWRMLEFLPGVPIFFFVSGLLIPASWARTGGWRPYAANRALRIFPALWVAFVLSVVSVWASGYFATIAVAPLQAGAWVLSQLGGATVYNPDFLRGYGVGVLNGSLWTIPVELQFYILMPLLAWALAHRPALWWGAFAVFAAAHMAQAFGDQAFGGSGLATKLLFVSFLPWIALFMLGQLVQAHWARVAPWVRGRLGVWTLVWAGFAGAGVAAETALGLRLSGNALPILAFPVVAGLVLAAAHTRPGLAARWLGGRDLSYGIYIYHMPVINAWLYADQARTPWALGVCAALTIGLAALSWRLIERPALSLKFRGL